MSQMITKGQFRYIIWLKDRTEHGNSDWMRSPGDRQDEMSFYRSGMYILDGKKIIARLEEKMKKQYPNWTKGQPIPDKRLRLLKERGKR